MLVFITCGACLFTAGVITGPGAELVLVTVVVIGVGTYCGILTGVDSRDLGSVTGCDAGTVFGLEAGTGSDFDFIDFWRLGAYTGAGLVAIRLIANCLASLTLISASLVVRDFTGDCFLRVTLTSSVSSKVCGRSGVLVFTGNIEFTAACVLGVIGGGGGWDTGADPEDVFAGADTGAGRKFGAGADSPVGAIVEETIGVCADEVGMAWVDIRGGMPLVEWYDSMGCWVSLALGIMVSQSPRTGKRAP